MIIGCVPRSRVSVRFSALGCNLVQCHTVFCFVFCFFLLFFFFFGAFLNSSPNRDSVEKSEPSRFSSFAFFFVFGVGVGTTPQGGGGRVEHVTSDTPNRRPPAGSVEDFSPSADPRPTPSGPRFPRKKKEKKKKNLPTPQATPSPPPPTPTRRRPSSQDRIQLPPFSLWLFISISP